MRFTCALLSLTLASSAFAASFDDANRSWLERSYSRACDGFTEVVKTDPSNREAIVKRWAACQQVGKSGGEDISKIADGAEKDFARALALHALWNRGSRSFDVMAPALKSQLAAEGRRGKEARSLYDAAVLRELDNNAWNAARAEKVAADALATEPSAELVAAIRFRRAKARVNSGTKVSEGEAELLDVGKGSSDLADDALFMLGQRRENDGKYVAALEHYDEVVKRFSPTTSNARSNAEYAARNIRAPQLSVYVPNNELPGMKPQVSVNFRNLTTTSFTLRRTDPFTLSAGTWPDDPSAFGGAVIKTWTTALKEPSRHAPGTLNFELDDVGPGIFALEAKSGTQTSRAWALVTQLAVVTKADAKQAVVAVFDVETGAAQPDAEVVIFEHHSDGRHTRQLGRTDANGLATFKYEKNDDSKLVFVRKGAHLAWSGVAAAWWGSYSRENLAYVLVDRPLYKPGETAGLKLFLRSREGGPSVPVSGKNASLRVFDPTGKEVVKKQLTTNRFGTAQLAVPLAKNATLGAWRIIVEVDGEYWQQRQFDFRVEEYKPPEYVVSVEPLGQAKPGQPVRFKVKASYYSGGAVANANGRALVNVRGWSHQFGKWPDDPTDEASSSSPYGYDDDEYPRRGRYRGYGYDYYRPNYAQHTLQFKTGSDGTAEVEVPAMPAPEQDLEYAVQVFVTDSSRREINGNGSIKVSASPYFVDVKTDHLLYRPGERVTVSLRSEDANGRAANPDVVVRLMRLSDDGGVHRVMEVRTRLGNGVGKAMLDADVVGRARVEVLDGTETTEKVLASTELWLTSDSKPIVPGPGFQLLVDRAPLNVGQPLRVLVAGNRPGGHALLALEAESIALLKMVELKGRARFVELPMPADVAPNGWLSAVRVEDLYVQQRMVPVRARGSEVEFGVSVDFGRASSEPGSQVTASIKTTGAPNLASETALTIVDESIFAIAPEKTDFLSFIGRTNRQHMVRTQSSQDYRHHRARPTTKAEPQRRDNAGPTPDAAPKDSAAEATAPAPSVARGRALDDSPAEEKSKKSAEREQAPGGDEDRGGADPIKVRSDFSTSAGWFPQLEAKLGTTLTQSVKLKDSLTSWKAVATVVTEGPHVGQGSTKLKTAKPLMVRLQAPRFFIEGDEVVISALVESHLPKATDVEVNLSADGFKALTPTKVTVRVEPEQVQRVDAKFKVVALGDRQLRATVRAGSATDGMQWTLPALVHGSAQRQFFTGRVKDTQRFEFELPEKRKASLTKLELNLTPTLLSAMFDGLPYLAQYPYGCVEQTLSRFVPATIARRAVKDLGLPASRVPANLDDMTQQGLERLYNFQHADGGWGWWQSDNTNLWMTAYVVSSLSLAKSAGLDVRAAVITRGREYLVKNLGAALDSPETHAYAVYALASTGGAPKAALDTVYARRTQLTPRARAQLALSLLHVKDARARVAVENLDDVVKAAQARPDASVGDANDAWSTSAAIEATAFTLMAYARYDMKSPLIAPLTDFLVLRRNGGKWRTTRDTAFAIYALADLARRENAGARAGTFVISVNGKEVQRVRYTKGGLDLTAPVTLSDTTFTPGKNVVTISHDGGAATGYFGAQLDVFNMNDFIRGVGGDVKVKRTYTMLGKPSTDAKVPVSAEYGMPVESGVRVRVDLEVTANKAVEFVMLEDLKPAGFEAVQLTSGPAVCNYQCAHAELRTDRVAMFLPSIPVGVTKLSYELRAEVPGRFAALPARFEAMYAPEIQATADEMRFEVRDAPPANASK